MSSIIITEFKKIVKIKTGKEFNLRRSEIVLNSNKLSHNFEGARLFLENNIVELRFLRKQISQTGYLNKRRMLCTKNFYFAERFARFFSNPDKNPKQPKSSRPLSFYKKHNILLIWDLIENDYRMVSLKDWIILDFIPLSEDNISIINDFAKKINPRLIKENSKRTYFNK